MLQELSRKLIVVVGEDELSREAQRNATTTFMTHLRASLASKRVLSEYRCGGADTARTHAAWLPCCLPAWLHACISLPLLLHALLHVVQRSS